MAISDREIRRFWRTKYPWFFVMYILTIGILRSVVVKAEPLFALNIMMIAAFSSYIFLYIFYLYGVRPDEMEDWHEKYKRNKLKFRR